MTDLATTAPTIEDRLAAVPELGGGGRFRALTRNYGWQVAVALEFVAALLLWWYFTTVNPILPRSFLPPPSQVWEAMKGLFVTGTIFSHTLFTLQNFAAGFLLATVVSIPIGLLMGSSRLIELFAAPPMWAAYAVPRVALAPLFVLIFGMGAASKVALVFLMASFPILINTMQGVKSVNPSFIRVGQVYGGGRAEIGRTVILPAVLPYILAGLRIGVAGAIAGALIGEFIGSFEGLGMLLARAAFNFEVSRALALVAIVVLLAQGLMSVIQFVRKRVAPWDESTWA
ncbi:MAG TPA: ABC transporter permease [Acidimicrobiia bacterium]|nr:ABC transporter permease [Acidimicrobiia bacterium]